MRICRYCQNAIEDHDKLCSNCGYNPQTDTMTANFVRKAKKIESKQKQPIISSGVKSFMFWGMMVIVVSLGIKYQGKVVDLVYRAKDIILGNKSSKTAQALKKANQNKTVKLIDVRSSSVSASKVSGKNKKIEGIFYDPQGKSYVVINGQLISEKENFGNVVIKKINPASVEIVQDGHEQVLMVNQILDSSTQ